jgi:hypothetical protein
MNATWALSRPPDSMVTCIEYRPLTASAVGVAGTTGVTAPTTTLLITTPLARAWALTWRVKAGSPLS